jgi:hypothetical protein
LSAMAIDQPFLIGPADLVRMSAHEGHPGAGDYPVRLDVRWPLCNLS